MGIGILVLGFINPLGSTNAGTIQTGTGKMTVLFNGVEHGSLGFDNAPWAPGETRSSSIDIINAGEIDFLSTLDSGDYAPESMIHEFTSTLTNETGETLYIGPFADLSVNDVDTLVGHTEHLKLAVKWMPPENADLSVKRHGSFQLGVTAQQKIT
jgi:hypothetical protein